jgi:hypothetical protein
VRRVEQMETELKRREEVAGQRAEALTRRAAELASSSSVNDSAASGGESSHMKAGLEMELRRLGMQLEERRREVDRRAAVAAALEKAAGEREASALAAEAALDSAKREAQARLEADRMAWCVPIILLNLIVTVAFSVSLWCGQLLRTVCAMRCGGATAQAGRGSATTVNVGRR